MVVFGPQYRGDRRGSSCRADRELASDGTYARYDCEGNCVPTSTALEDFHYKYYYAFHQPCPNDDIGGGTSVDQFLATDDCGGGGPGAYPTRSARPATR
jgi:hypothetical protein